jgi:YVTN family beta-propeller protein
VQHDPVGVAGGLRRRPPFSEERVAFEFDKVPEQLAGDPIGARAGPDPGTAGIGSEDRLPKRTVYTANLADGEGPGTVSIINGAICNGQNTTGCGQTPATALVGFGALRVAVDPASDKVYVTNQEDASVSVINGATCNGHNTTGCSRAPRKSQ